MNVVEHATYHPRIRQDLSQLTFYGAARYPVADATSREFYHSEASPGRPTMALNFAHCARRRRGDRAARSEADEARQLALWRTAQAKMVEAGCSIPSSTCGRSGCAGEPGVRLHAGGRAEPGAAGDGGDAAAVAPQRSFRNRRWSVLSRPGQAHTPPASRMTCRHGHPFRPRARMARALRHGGHEMASSVVETLMSMLRTYGPQILREKYFDDHPKTATSASRPAAGPHKASDDARPVAPGALDIILFSTNSKPGRAEEEMPPNSSGRHLPRFADGHGLGRPDLQPRGVDRAGHPGPRGATEAVRAKPPAEAGSEGRGRPPPRRFKTAIDRAPFETGPNHIERPAATATRPPSAPGRVVRRRRTSFAPRSAPSRPLTAARRGHGASAASATARVVRAPRATSSPSSTSARTAMLVGVAARGSRRRRPRPRRAPGRCGPACRAAPGASRRTATTCRRGRPRTPRGSRAAPGPAHGPRRSARECRAPGTARPRDARSPGTPRRRRAASRSPSSWARRRRGDR